MLHAYCLEHNHMMVPAGYPESFLARLPVPHDVIGPLLSRLRSDDVYAQILHYPSPEHRSTALAQQVRVEPLRQANP